MLSLLVLLPLVLAAVTFGLPSNRWRPWLLPPGALGHLGLVAVAVFQPGDGAASRRVYPGGPVASGPGDWLLLDALGKVVLGFLSVPFTLGALYAPGYLA